MISRSSPQPLKNPRRSWPVADARRGITLFELALTLALLVIIATLTVPLVSDAFQTSRLSIGGDEVRQALEHARYHAMRTGDTYEFRFEVGGRRYRIRPWAALTSANLPGNSGPGGAAAAAGSSFAGGAETGEKTGEMPEEIVFLAMSSAGSTAVAAAAATEGDSTAWSVPILFYSDGTTTDATIRLKSDRGLYIDIRQRGLTGIVRVSEPLTLDEVQ